MDYIENLINHMSSTFNRESVLIKRVEISEDETFKWRALKNNQFACRSKITTQKKHQNNDDPSEDLTKDNHRNASTLNDSNNIVIEIANGISKAELEEALTRQSDSRGENNRKQKGRQCNTNAVRSKK